MQAVLRASLSLIPNFRLAASVPLLRSFPPSSEAHGLSRRHPRLTQYPTAQKGSVRPSKAHPLQSPSNLLTLGYPFIFFNCKNSLFSAFFTIFDRAFILKHAAKIQYSVLTTKFFGLNNSILTLNGYSLAKVPCSRTLPHLHHLPNLPHLQHLHHTPQPPASPSSPSMQSPVSLPKVAVGYVWRTASAMSYRSSRTKGQTSLSGCLATPWCRYIIVATSSLVAKSQTSASSNGVPSMSSRRARGYSSNACRKASIMPTAFSVCRKTAASITLSSSHATTYAA